MGEAVHQIITSTTTEMEMGGQRCIMQIAGTQDGRHINIAGTTIAGGYICETAIITAPFMSHQIIISTGIKMVIGGSLDFNYNNTPTGGVIFVNEPSAYSHVMSA